MRRSPTRFPPATRLHRRRTRTNTTRLEAGWNRRVGGEPHNLWGRPSSALGRLTAASIWSDPPFVRTEPAGADQAVGEFGLPLRHGGRVVELLDDFGAIRLDDQELPGLAGTLPRLAPDEAAGLREEGHHDRCIGAETPRVHASRV